MKRVIVIAIIILVLLVAGFFMLNSYIYKEKQGDTTMPQNQTTEKVPEIMPEVTPISHATMVLKWGDKIIYTDPVGATAFSGQPEPDLILLTDIHGDHLDLEALRAVSKDKTTIIAPKAVAEKLPNTILGKVIDLNNGEVGNEQGFSIQAIPMYNLPEAPDSFHVKGRGNGYVVEAGGKRVYVSGDTADIPEMRNLQNIDMAFVAMNLPYTMSVESAADAVLAFKPKQVYPYHYRGPDGLSDVNKFKEIVNAGNPNIEVVLLNWYPE